MDALAIAQALLRCPSVTPADAGALDTLQDLLEPAGFSCHRLPFSSEGTPTIDNLYARVGSDAPCFLFAGHTDVVPPGTRESWRHDPFAGTVEDGLLYGRGAQDMKGGIAAFVAAALAFLAQQGPPRGSIALLVTGDEEGPAINGTTRLLEWAEMKGERFDHCIVGEPTSRAKLGDTIKVGRRGSLNGQVVANGRQGHVAYPAKADNPIPALLRVIEALMEPLDGGTERFEPSNLVITTIDVGNRATNVIPERATAAFNIRFNDRWTAETLRRELEERTARAAVGSDVRLSTLPCNAPSFLTPRSSFLELVEDAVASETGGKPTLSTGGGTSDARFIQRFCPVVELGLVGDRMHMVDECVPVAELRGLASIFGRILSNYFR